MPLMHDGLLLSGGARRNSSLAAVVADAIDRRTIVDDRGVVDVVNRGDVYIGDRAIVEEPSVIPTSAFEAFSGITKTIVDAAIETDMGAPIAVIENIPSLVPGPVWWRPEIAGFRGRYPGAWNPVIVAFVITPRPIAGRPNVTLAGAERLLVDGKRWRAETHRKTKFLSERSRSR